MKRMLCNQLGGPDDCLFAFEGETFQEIAQQSKEHAMKMVAQGDVHHQEKMKEMGERLQRDAEEVQKWFTQKQTEFEQLEELKK